MDQEIGEIAKGAVPAGTRAAEDPLSGRILNLCLGGMYVQLDETAVHLPVGERFTAVFSVPKNDLQLRYLAKVIHVQNKPHGPQFGFHFLGDAKQVVHEVQERTLWQYLTDEQRKKNQLLYDEVRTERMHRARLLSQLKELQLCYAAVKTAGSLFYAVLLAVVLGLAGAGGVAAFLYSHNNELWNQAIANDEVLKKYAAQPPDFENAVPHEIVATLPIGTFEERQKDADGKHDKEVQRLRKDYERRLRNAQGEYAPRKTSFVTIVASAFTVGALLAVAVWFAGSWRRPGRLEHAQQGLKKKLRHIVEKYPEDVRSWDGKSPSEIGQEIEGLIAAVEAKAES